MTAPVRVSVLMPVYNTPEVTLRAAIRSALSQRASFELVVVDDASTSPAVGRVLAEVERHPRVRVLRRESNGGIVKASDDALAAARGEFVALLDHDDLLALDCLEEVERVLDQYADVDYVYTDEDKISDSGEHFDVFAKPDWSPERLRCQMYTGHLSVIRTSLAREVGGFDERAEGSQDHDLVLRVTERARRVVHIPRVLYHWRAIRGSVAMDETVKPYAHDAGLAAVQRHVERVGIQGTACSTELAHTYRVVRHLDPSVLVSIVIPTRGTSALVWGERRCMVVELVRSILQLSTHRNIEIVVVYDRPTPQEVLDELTRLGGPQMRLVLFDEPFNFSAKCNVGLLAASAEHVVFLNDDMEVVSPDFLAQLVGPLSEDGVGATGARLLFADGTLQHGGHVYESGDLTHAGLGAPGDDEGPFRAYRVSRECSGLTAACLATTRRVMDEVGGFCEGLPGNFNDVDLSYKIRAQGYRMLWIADATLYHFESVSRDPTVHSWEYTFVMDRWGTPDTDPYFPGGSQVRPARGTLDTARAAVRLLRREGVGAVWSKVRSRVSQR